ncbi:MAG: PDR/VanB family oxidoreductase [Porticoccaceae bacterium]|nr:oxidoreductase [Pseudomonadales bacterium]MCP5172129.1 oxidoreductase [Pseudomonadales bacterium]
MTLNQADKAVEQQQLSQGRIYGIPVRVAEINEESEGVISITMCSEDGNDLPSWQAGAHIDLVIDDQLELVRQYSLCGNPADKKSLKIAVLREPQSRGGSEALHTKLNVGDKLTVKGPRNHFPLNDADNYLMIAGGIGITPMLPMLRELEKTGKNWTMMYGGRTRSSMAFLSELSQYGDKVKVCPEDEVGLLDLNNYIGSPKEDTVVYVCGPEKLISAVEKQCEDWPEGALNLERFKPVEIAPVGGDVAFEVVLQQSGVSIQVEKDESIADAVERAGFYIPRSCDEGTCGTCMTRIIEGVPEHRDSFLRGKMREENKYIMVCCSRASSPKLVLDA